MKTLYQVEEWYERLGKWVEAYHGESKDDAIGFIRQSPKGQYRIHELFVVE